MAVLIFVFVIIASFNGKVEKDLQSLTIHQEQAAPIVFTHVSSISASQFIHVFQILEYVYAEAILIASASGEITPSFHFDFTRAGVLLYNSVCINAP